MSEVLQTNVFFVITSIAVVAVTILIGIALYYVIRILRAVKEIAEKVQGASEMIAEDALHIRNEVLSGNFFGTVLARLMSFSGFAKRTPPRRKTKPVVEEEDSIGSDN